MAYVILDLHFCLDQASGYPLKTAWFCLDCVREMQKFSAQSVQMGIRVPHLYLGVLQRWVAFTQPWEQQQQQQQQQPPPHHPGSLLISLLLQRGQTGLLSHHQVFYGLRLTVYLFINTTIICKAARGLGNLCVGANEPNCHQLPPSFPFSIDNYTMPSFCHWHHDILPLRSGHSCDNCTCTRSLTLNLDHSHSHLHSISHTQARVHSRETYSSHKQAHTHVEHGSACSTWHVTLIWQLLAHCSRAFHLAHPTLDACSHSFAFVFTHLHSVYCTHRTLCAHYHRRPFGMRMLLHFFLPWCHAVEGGESWIRVSLMLSGAGYILVISFDSSPCFIPICLHSLVTFSYPVIPPVVLF
jgi:hypothetical protein